MTLERVFALETLSYGSKVDTGLAPVQLGTFRELLWKGEMILFARMYLGQVWDSKIPIEIRLNSIEFQDYLEDSIS